MQQVIKLKPSGEQYTYFLHYMGWNSRWDKWVVESDLMPAGPEALEMQKQLKDKKKKDKVSSIPRRFLVICVFVSVLLPDWLFFAFFCSHLLLSVRRNTCLAKLKICDGFSGARSMRAAVHHKTQRSSSSNGVVPQLPREVSQSIESTSVRTPRRTLLDAALRRRREQGIQEGAATNNNVRGRARHFAGTPPLFSQNNSLAVIAVYDISVSHALARVLPLACCYGRSAGDGGETKRGPEGEGAEQEGGPKDQESSRGRQERHGESKRDGVACFELHHLTPSVCGALRFSPRHTVSCTKAAVSVEASMERKVRRFCKVFAADTGKRLVFLRNIAYLLRLQLTTAGFVCS